MQNGVLHVIGNIFRCPPVHEFPAAFKIRYMYGYMTKLFSTQAELIQNLVNQNLHGIAQVEVKHRKYKSLKVGGVRPTTVHLTDHSFRVFT
jgi:hypothetical protein